MREVEADLVLNAIVGFAGLEVDAGGAGGRPALALANKESLVCAGGLVTGLAAAPGRDASCRSIRSTRPSFSWSPPRDATRSTRWSSPRPGDRSAAGHGPNLGRVTREEALAHPTWSMGEKITIDSATLMNKGLEVIEAHHLFGLPYERIEVVVHPQSLVHALVRLVDGALLSHLGSPDMRVPIAFALHYPERVRWPRRRLDLAAGMSLEFESPGRGDVPCDPPGSGGRRQRATMPPVL